MFPSSWPTNITMTLKTYLVASDMQPDVVTSERRLNFIYLAVQMSLCMDNEAQGELALRASEPANQNAGMGPRSA